MFKEFLIHMVLKLNGERLFITVTDVVTTVTVNGLIKILIAHPSETKKFPKLKFLTYFEQQLT